MDKKKSKKASLENKRTLFFEIGVILSLGLILLGFQWTKTELNSGSLGSLPDMLGEEEIIPITRQELEKPITPPKPQAVILELNIVDDDIELDDDFELDDFEANQDDNIELMIVEEEEEDADYAFIVVEDMPQFQGGGITEFHRYIQGNITYPRIAEENNITGTVYVEFIIDQYGVLTKIKILRGVDTMLDNEVIRALKAAPKWTPGLQRGKAVPVRMNMPVRFTLF